MSNWRDHVATRAEPELSAEDGTLACWKQDNVRYCSSWLEGGLADALMLRAATDAGLPLHRMPQGMRVRQTGRYRFVFNYAASASRVPGSLAGDLLIGERVLNAAHLAVIADG